MSREPATLTGALAQHPKTPRGRHLHLGRFQPTKIELAFGDRRVS
jgi:hypothetical protein